MPRDRRGEMARADTGILAVARDAASAVAAASGHPDGSAGGTGELHLRGHRRNVRVHAAGYSPAGGRAAGVCDTNGVPAHCGVWSRGGHMPDGTSAAESGDRRYAHASGVSSAHMPR